MVEEPQTDRKVIKEHLYDLYTFFRKWFCYLLEKGTGNKCEDHKGTTLFIGAVILYFVSTGILSNLGFFSSLLKEVKATYPENNLASVNTANPIKISSPQNDAPRETERCNLNNGPWNRWYGNVSQGMDDKNYFILPTNSGGFLFQYTGNIEDITTCKFSFIPRGESTMNYVISLDGIYQIVVGDNDFWTITLKATDRIDGDLLSIEENVTGKTRPRLLSRARKGTRVDVLLTQKFLENKKYEVTAEISYKPDINSSSEISTEKFIWVFDPSPIIHDSARLSVGLIRDPKDTSEIGANFITPSLSQNKKQ